MKYLSLIALLLVAPTFAQSIALSVSPASVPPGGAAVLTLTYTDAAPTANVAALQWKVTAPAGITVGTMALGAATTAANKVLSCGPSACIGIGSGATLNTTAIASGVVATVPLTVAAGTAIGPISVSLANVMGATGPGLALPVTTAAVTLNVTYSLYDLTKDGVVNNADIQLSLNQADGTTPCTSGDVNGDGVCNDNDVELEILAAMGVIH